METEIFCSPDLLNWPYKKSTQSLNLRDWLSKGQQNFYDISMKDDSVNVSEKRLLPFLKIIV